MRPRASLYGLESGDPIADFDLIGFSWAMRWPIPTY